MPGYLNDHDNVEESVVQEGSDIIFLQVYIHDYLFMMPHDRSIVVFGNHWTFEDLAMLPVVTNRSPCHGPGRINDSYLIEDEPASVVDFGNSHFYNIIGRVGWYGRFWAENYINNRLADRISRLGRIILEGSRRRSPHLIYDGLTCALGNRNQGSRSQWNHAAEKIPYQFPIYSGSETDDLIELLCSSFQEGFIFRHDTRLVCVIELVFGFYGRPIPALPVD